MPEAHEMKDMIPPVEVGMEAPDKDVEGALAKLKGKIKGLMPGKAE